MKTQKTEWIEFSIYENSNLRAKALKVGKTIKAIKLLFNAPRGQYHSFFIDAMETANKTLK
jgi:hypothetical protein